ncbi:unnamed protein product [Cochlearia groenlandica]
MKANYWIDIKANLHTRKLTPGTKYKAVFVVKLEDYAEGWDKHVNLTMQMIKRDNSQILQEETVCLDYYIGDEWVDIKVGEFIAPPKDVPAKIIVTMSKHDNDSDVKKTGLVVKGATFREV